MILVNGNKHRTGSTTGSTLFNLTNWNTLAGIIQSSNTLTNTSAGSNGRLMAVNSFASGSIFILQVDASVTENGGLIEIVTSPNTPQYQVPGFLQWIYSSSTSGRWICEINGTGYNDYTNITFSTITPIARIRGTGTLVYLEQSYDNGVTWTSIAGSPSFTQPSTLMVQAEFNNNGDTLRNIKCSPSI